MTSENIPSHSLQKSFDDFSSLRTDLLNNISAKFQSFEHLFEKKIEALQQQLDKLSVKVENDLEKRVSIIEKGKASLTDELQEKIKEIKILREDQHELKSTIHNLKKALRESESEHDNKIAHYAEEIQRYETSSEAEKQNTVELQKALAQVSSESQEKAQKILTLNEKQRELQSAIQKLESTLKETKNSNGIKITELTKEIDNYRNFCNTEKQNAVRKQEALMTELQEKSKETEALRESKHELQLAIQKLENTLRKSKSKYAKKINECTQQCERLIDAEKEKTVGAQQALINVSTELQALEQRQHKLLCEKQGIEDVSKQYELHIEELKNSNKHLQIQKENNDKSLFEKNECIRKLQSALQDKSVSLLQEKQKFESAIKSLHDENNMLKVTNDELNKQLSENLRKCESQELTIQHLQEKAKEALSLKESQQLIIQKLENTLKKSESEHNSKITECTKELQKYENLCDIEKNNSLKMQEALIKASAELQEKVKEVVVLEQSQHKLLCEKQSIDQKLKDISQQYELHVKELESSNEQLQAEKEDANKKLSELQLAIQVKNTSLLQEKENFESVIKRLHNEMDVLKKANERLQSAQSLSKNTPIIHSVFKSMWIKPLVKTTGTKPLDQSMNITLM